MVPEITLFVLVLSWLPASPSAKPVLNHMTYETKEACERNIKAMEKVFETMQNPTASMICQPLRPVSR